MKIKGTIERVTTTVDKTGNVWAKVVLSYDLTKAGAETVSELVAMQNDVVTASIESEQLDLGLEVVDDANSAT